MRLKFHKKEKDGDEWNMKAKKLSVDSLELCYIFRLYEGNTAVGDGICFKATCSVRDQ